METYVVLFDVVAVEAFDIEESSVQQFELLSGVVCSLRESYLGR
jgi:hypothetical protein